MKVFAVTSNYYIHLMTGFSELFNRYWSPEQEVTVLGYDKLPPPLPDNFEFISLGKQASFRESWCDGLMPFMDSIADPYFVLLLEDDFLIGEVDLADLKEAEDMVRGGAASKVLLYSEPTYPQEAWPGSTFFNVWKTDGHYRTSLTPSIWAKDYFVKYLHSGFSAWDFERRNMESAKGDGATILLLRNGAVYPYFGAYRQGKFDVVSWQAAHTNQQRKFGPADWQILEQEPEKVLQRFR
jgi:hypothetical protein